MNPFQLIDELAKLKLTWTVTKYCHAVCLPLDGTSPLQVYTKCRSFEGAIWELQQKRVPMRTIHIVQKACDGYLHREDAEVMRYRDYLLRSLTLTDEAKELLKRGWPS